MPSTEQISDIPDNYNKLAHSEDMKSPQPLMNDLSEE